MGGMDERYDYALAAALVVLDQLASKPGMIEAERLAMVTFTILHGMERYEADRPKLQATASHN